MNDICMKYGVTVISDEIHCELMMPGHTFQPFAAVSEACRQNSVILNSPSKSFNIAGLQTAAIYVPDEVLFHKVWRGINTDEVAEPNAFAITAAIAAFNEGEDWLDELRGYIYENKKTVVDYIAKNIPGVRVVPSHATYLLWLDCSSLPEVSSRLADEIREDTGLYLASGSHYGKGGELFLRMNVACRKALVMEGLEKLKTALTHRGGIV